MKLLQKCVKNLLPHGAAALAPFLLFFSLVSLQSGLAWAGFIDAANCSVVSGWACEEAVHFYLDSPTGLFLGTALANQPRPDNPCGGAHGFTFPTSSVFQDGQPHTIYAQAGPLDGSGPFVALPPSTPGASTLSCSSPPTCIYESVYPDVPTCWPGNFNGRGGNATVMRRGSSDPALALYDYAPSVMKDGNTYKMWWCAGVAGDYILYSEASSLDGPWSSPQTALAPTGQNTFDGSHACDPSVIRVNGTYYMYYGGLKEPFAPPGGTNPYNTSNFGVASSPDGKTWTRLNNGNPIMMANILPGQPGWNEVPNKYGAGQPSVTYANGKYYLIHTDTTGKAGNPFNGGGVYVLRSADPTFQTGVEELVGPGNFQPYSAATHTSYTLDMNKVGVDWLYNDQLDSFALASHGVYKRLDLVFLNSSLSGLAVSTISIKPNDWIDGPGLVGTPDRHVVTDPVLAGRLHIDTMRANGVPPDQFATWDLAHMGFDLNLPAGSHESTTNSAVSGWACDGDDYTQPLTIKFRDQNNTLLGTTLANQSRPDVAAACGGNAAHGFVWTPPADGNSHQIYAYVVNIGNPPVPDQLLAGPGSGITVTSTLLPPVITSLTTFSMLSAQSIFYSYKITATNSPTHFSADNLPPGLSINTTSGIIFSGSKVSPGVYPITLHATNAGGTGNAILNVTVTNPISQQPQNMTVTVGQTATFSLGLSSAPQQIVWFNITRQQNVKIESGGGLLSSSYTTPPTILEDNGSLFRCELYYGGGFALTNEFTLTVLPSVPTATAQVLTTAFNTPIAVTLSGTDLSNLPLTYTIVTGPAHGTLSGAGASRTYTPTSGFAGSDSFTFKTNNGYLDSSNATVSITVNNPPAPTANAQTVTTAFNTAKAITLSGGDPNSLPLMYTIVTIPAHGTLSGSGASRLYTPSAGYAGPDSFTFKVNNGFADSLSAVVSVTVANPPAPTANAQTVTVTFNTPKALTLSGADPSNLPLTYTIVTSPAHGVLSGSVTSLTYTPTSGFVGSDSFTFKANNGFVDSPVSQVSITVTPATVIPLAPSAPNLSELDGRTFHVGDDLILNYSGDATGFNWEIDPASVAGRTLSLGLPASAKANVTTTAPRLSLANLSLSPGAYLVRAQTVNGSQTSSWASATIHLAGENVVSVRVYPNPVRAGRGDQAITFDQMPANSTVKIFTVSGRWVKTLSAPTGSVSWDLRNDSGERVASGLYLYLAADAQGNKTRGKFTVIR